MFEHVNTRAILGQVPRNYKVKQHDHYGVASTRNIHLTGLQR